MLSIIIGKTRNTTLNLVQSFIFPKNLTGIKKVILILRHFLLFCILAFLLTLFAFFKLDSIYQVIAGIGEIGAIFITGIFFLFLMPRRIHDYALCCFLLGMSGYFLFWIYVFLVIHFVGPPMW